jgi:V/A-type H+-transporting ATPase subunit D
MIHPTRTELMQLRDRAVSVVNSVSILRARRHALIRSFLESVRPYARSRDAIRLQYAEAIAELQLSEGHEGQALIDALAATAERDVGVDIAERHALGVRYRDLTVYGPFVRTPLERDYGYTLTTPHLEESLHRFESVLAAMLEIAAFESRVKTLGEEIVRVTRRTRMLEERVLPRLRADIRTIVQYIAERERETHFRLRRFKFARERRAATADRRSPGSEAR